MAMNDARNPKELKDLVLRRLGAPIIQIEVTEDQIYDCIGRSLELYKEYHYDALNKAYITIKLTTEMVNTRYIDLKEFPIFAVTKIVRQRANMYGGLGGGASLNFFTDFLVNLGAGPMGASYHGPYGALGNIGFFAQFQSYQFMLQDQLDPLPDYWFDAHNGVLQLTGGNSLTAGDTLVLEVYIQAYMDMEQTRDIVGSDSYNFGFTIGCDEDHSAGSTMQSNWQNPYKRMSNQAICSIRNEFPDQAVYSVRWVKDYTAALVKEIWGQVLAKHSGLMLPGGVTTDGQRLIEEARMEKEALRQELLMLSEPDTFFMG